jgi:hypothetical protein
MGTAARPGAAHKIVAGFNEVKTIPSVREALQKQALQPVEPMNTSQLEELYSADTEKYAKIIREANIKLSDQASGR